ncbi:MAG: glycoside hydrolase family 2 protein [Bacteroidales bacterium]|nr:glycoside hydrolase family 2 protein [Bacteroidales bacterium]
MKKLFLTGMAVLLCVMLFSCKNTAGTSSETASVEWPEITRQTKPWSRWWWEGSAARPGDITAAMEAYQAAGLGGLEITPIYGVHGYEDRFLDFLSPEWMDVFMFTLREGTRLDMGIDLANASGWPFGGPWVDSTYSCKYMTYTTYKVASGEKLNTPLTYIQRPIVRTAGSVQVSIRDLKAPVTANSDLQTLALDQVRYERSLPLIAVVACNADGTSVVLTDKVDADKMLQWTAPEGEWTVYALFQGYHGKMVERAGPGGEGDVIDHFAAEPTQKYLQRFDEAFKGYDISSLRYYFNDSYEVDDANGESNWTPGFLSEFKARRGYDLLEYLPALLGNTPESGRVKHDYRRTLSDLLLDGYTRTWQRWAAAQGKGIRNQAHGSPANILDLYGVSDVPETEGREIIASKTASSVAHVLGKPLTSSETATWLGEHFESKLSEVKTCVDGFLLAGVNHIFYHGTCFSPQDAPWPGWLFYAAVHFTPTNPFWKDFGTLNQYIARCQSFLQAGQPDNDILLYYNISDVWSMGGRALLQHFKGLDTNFDPAVRGMAQNLMDNGYAWDFITDRQLQDVTVRNGMVRTAGGDYSTIILPICEYIPAETFDKLMALVRKGATLVVYGAFPQHVAGLKDYEKQEKNMLADIAKLEFDDGESFQTASYGKGRILLGNYPVLMLEGAGVRREAMYDKGLQCIRRKDGNKTYYFIANRTGQEVNDWIPLAVDAASFALYEPMTGRAGTLTPHSSPEGPTVMLQLQPGASCIVETSTDQLSGEPYVYYKPKGYPVPFNAPWSLSFTTGGPVLPDTVEITELGSWTDYGDESYRDFSGTASYTTSLPAVQADSAAAYLLDLGDLEETAAVYLNGAHLQTLLSAPYQVLIDASLLNGKDILTVEISNSMANRIAWLDRQGFAWKVFYNTNFPARRPENSNRGVFDASGWAPRASGLFGPVTLTPVTPVQFEE